METNDTLTRNAISYHPHLTLLIDSVIATMASTLAVTVIRTVMGTFLDFQHHAVIWSLAAMLGYVLGAHLTGSHKILARYMALSSMTRYIGAIITKELFLLVLLLTDAIYFGNGQQEFGLLVCDFTTTICFILFARVIVIVMGESSINNIATDVNRMPVMVCDHAADSIPVLNHLSNDNNYRVMGILSSDAEADGHILNGIQIHTITSTDDLNRLKEEIGFEGVVVSSANKDDDCKANLIDMCVQLSLNVLMAPTVETLTYGGSYTRHTVSQMNRRESFIPDGMSAFSRNAKRIIDCTLAFLLLIVFSPSSLSAG